MIRGLLTLTILLLVAIAPFSFPTTGQAPPARAKTESNPQQDQVVRLSSQLILVPVSATDASGEPVKNLTVDDFIIEEEGKPQQIISLGEPGKSPIEIALLFDISSSISAQFPFEQEAAVGFVKSVLKPTDSISIFSIGVTPKLVLPRTAVTEAAIRSILTIQPVREPTAFFDSIVDATLYLSKSADAGSRRVIVVISDGEENYSKRFKLAEALSELQRHDCLFYSINPSGQALKLNTMSRKGQDAMEQMSSHTGGKAFVPEKIEDLNAHFRQIADELQAQYLFGYYSSDERADGSFRRITVRASKRPDLRVRARQGYYARKS